MVEFAIILPLLVLLVFGITELGRALYQWNTLTKAVHAGARYMARANNDAVTDTCGTGTNWGSYEAKAKNIIKYGSENTGADLLLPHLDDSNITISVRSGGAAFPGACVIEVEATNVDFDWAVWAIPGITLTARTEERYIGE